MQAKVIRDFHDKETNEFHKKNNPYSHSDEGRIDSLIKKGFLTEKLKQPPKETITADGMGEIKHLGGGYYELPNGDRVRGKKKALAKLESGE